MVRMISIWQSCDVVAGCGWSILRGVHLVGFAGGERAKQDILLCAFCIRFSATLSGADAFTDILKQDAARRNGCHVWRSCHCHTMPYFWITYRLIGPGVKQALKVFNSGPYMYFLGVLDLDFQDFQ